MAANKFKYSFHYTDQAGHHTGEASSAADLRRQINAIIRQGGEIPSEEIRVIDREVKSEQR